MKLTYIVPADIISTVIQIYRNWLQRFHCVQKSMQQQERQNLRNFCQTNEFDDFFETKGV